jgi:hypothetical protein
MSPTALPVDSRADLAPSLHVMKEGVPTDLSKQAGKSCILHRTPWHPPIAVSAQGELILGLMNLITSPCARTLHKVTGRQTNH